MSAVDDSVPELLPGRLLSSINVYGMRLVATALLLLQLYGPILIARGGDPALAWNLVLLPPLAWASWFVWQLYAVRAAERGLKFRRRWHTTFVEYDEIVDVRWFGCWAAFVVVLPAVTVITRRPDGSTKKFRFLARFTTHGWVGKVHPVVVELKAKIGRRQL